MSDINETVAPLATEAGQDAIVLAINNISSFSYAVRAENAATTATQKASEASDSAADALAYRNAARNWATKMDTYVDTETITIPAEQEGEEDTTETVYLFSARYYAALAQDFYNNMTFDNAPTQNSTNLLTSGTIYTALADKADSATTLSGYGITDAYTKTEIDTALGNVQSTLTFDSAPTQNSTNPVTSGGLYTAFLNVLGSLTFDNAPTLNSDNPVKSGGIYTALASKADSSSIPTKVSDLTNDSGFITGVAWNDVSSKPTFATVATSGSYSDLSNKPTVDSAPTQNSTNLVESGGVYTAIANATPNITTDTEPTEDSANLITSGAVWEALQNFTPSGDGVIAGSLASGIQREELWSGTWSSGNITLSNSLLDYDLLEFWTNNPSNSNYYTWGQPKLISPKEIIKTNSDNPIEITGESGRYFAFYYSSNTQLTYKSKNTNECRCIYGIKFSKNLSEQMYSNVLYENSSGWSSGNASLNDNIDNYDFIEFIYGESSYPLQRYSMIFGKEELLNYINNGNSVVLNGASDRYFVFTVSSVTQLSYYARGNNVVYKIVGYKMAKGGYSGIVSDARMTVKSGTVTLGNSLSANSGYEYNVTFDSPMPDTNYIVQLSGSNLSAYWADINYTAKDKTVNGFTVVAWITHAINESHTLDWIAIRPNSYTREGMVEDVLFSNASGVNSGTINLSGNISDYDLIYIYTNRGGANNQLTETPCIFLSSHLLTLTGTTGMLNSASIFGYSSDYIHFYYMNDNTLNIILGTNLKILKITGIKFGRYVSGVAVDTTVTQNSDAVVTSGAVYDALLNIPSGGGGGGSITIDSVPTENSQNAVSSGGVYDALQNIPSGSSTTVDSTITKNSQNPVTSAAIYSAIQDGLPFEFRDIVPQDMLIYDEHATIYTQSSRSYRKEKDGYAAVVVVTNDGDNFVRSYLISDNSDAVDLRCNLDYTNTPTVGTVIVDGKTYYWTKSPLNLGSETSYTTNYRSIQSTGQSSGADAVRWIINNLLYPTAQKTLANYRIGDAYTKTEVDTLLQNAGGGSSITLDITPTQNSNNPVTSDGIYSCLANVLSLSGTQLKDDGVYYLDKAGDIIIKKGTYGNIVKTNDGAAIGFAYNYCGWVNAGLIALNDNAAKIYSTNSNGGQDSGTYTDNNGNVWYYYTQNCNTSDYSEEIIPIMYNKQNINYSKSKIIADALTNAVNAILNTYVISKDTTPTQNSNNLITSGGVYTALASKGDVTTNTDQNITGTKTFVGSKKVGFKQSAANDKLGFTLYGNTGTERGYLEFNPTNTVDGVTGLMTLGNYATSAAALTQVGFRRYSNISGASGAYNLLMPMVADARTPFSLTTTYQNFYLPLGFTDGTTTVKTAKSGVVDLSPLLASLEARIAALEGN